MVLRPHQYPADIGLSGTNLTRAGDHNYRVVLQAMHSHGQLTRGELAKITGLTHQTAITITKRLIADGMVLDLGRTVGARGQPAMRLTINPEGAYAAGLTVDHDHMTAVILDLSGRTFERIHSERRFATPADALTFVKSALESAIGRRRIPRKRLIGLGLVIPDRLSSVDVPKRPESYDQWSRIDVAKAFSAALNLPVYVKNQAAAAAICELQFGQGRQHKSFVYVLIGTGVDSALIINGQPHLDELDHANGMGNIPIASERGQVRTLGHLVSLPSLYEHLAQKGFLVAHPQDLKSDGGEMELLIDKWVAQAAHHMIEPFIALAYTLSLPVFVIGGQLPVFIAEKLSRALNCQLDAQEGHFPITRFTTSGVSVDAPAIGASVVVFQNNLLPGAHLLKARF